MRLWPSKKQWNSWTLPSKLGAIGGYASILGIFLAIAVFVWNYYSRPNLATIVKKVSQEQTAELSRRYPTAYTVFGVYRDGFVVPKGEMPDNIEIDWSTGGVDSTSPEAMIVRLPDMILNGKSRVHSVRTSVPKRIGAKSAPIIKLGWFNPIVEVIGIHDELVVVALGFPAEDTKE